MKSLIKFMALAAIILVSCTKEDGNNTTPEPEIVNGTPVLKARIANTKTSLDGLALSFMVGDQISVFNGIKDESNHHGVSRYVCTGISAGVATFAFDPENSECATVDADIDPLIATHPQRSASTAEYEAYGAGTLKIRMVAGPIDTDNGFAAPSLPIIACADAGDALDFNLTVGLFEVVLKGTASIATIALTSNQNINGDASVDYTSATPVLTMVGTGKTNTYRYNHDSESGITSGIALNESTGVKFYFGLPAGTHNVKFVFTDTEGNTMTKNAEDLTIERAKITRSKNALTFAPDIVPTVNLSEGGKYANCYVVKAPGNYEIDARKPDGTLVSGSSAVWVWASGEKCNGATGLPVTMMKDIGYNDDKISFSVPESYGVGNVVLGIVDGSSNLLYTWHIWLTSDDIEDVTAGGITVMDRNLGAGALYDVTLAANAPLQAGKGNFYQWGRKDPFPGGRNSSTGTIEATPFGTTNSQYNIINTGASINNVSEWGANADLGGVSAEDGASHPVTLAKSAKVPGYDSSDTTTPWCGRTNANPCPYGYRVMNKSEFSTLIGLGAVASNYNNFGQMKLADAVILPRAGFRAGTTGGSQYGQTSARYYCNDVSDTEATKGYAYKFDWTNTSTYSSYTETTYNAYNACSVRCVKQ